MAKSKTVVALEEEVASLKAEVRDLTTRFGNAMKGVNANFDSILSLLEKQTENLLELSGRSDVTDCENRLDVLEAKDQEREREAFLSSLGIVNRVA